MKKTALFAAVLLLLLNVCMTAGALESRLSLSAPESVSSGRAFKAVVSLESGETICALQLRVTYGDDLKYGKARLLTDGRISESEEENCVQIVCMSSEGLSGDIAELSFVAEKGDTRTASVTVEVIQAVDGSDKVASLEGCSADIGIVGKSSDTDEKASSFREESRNRSAKETSKSSRSSSSKRVSSSRTSSASSERKRRASSTESLVSERKRNTPDAPYRDLGSVSRKDGKLRYAAAGALFAFSAVGFAFIFYRLGASSRNRPH